MTPSQPVRVLVLGGAGMLGHLLIRHLGECSSLAVRWTTRRGEDGGIPFDIQGGAARVQDLLARMAPIDYIGNCIAVLQANIDERSAGSIRLAEEINGAFPHRLAEAARAHGARIL